MTSACSQLTLPDHIGGRDRRGEPLNGGGVRGDGGGKVNVRRVLQGNPSLNSLSEQANLA